MILLTPNYKIEFTADPHGYLVDGEPETHYSEIVRLNGVASAIPDFHVMRQAAIRGTYSHDGSHLIAAGGIDWDSVYKPWEGYLRAYDSFWNEFGDKLIAHEMPLYNKELKYCCTFDQLIKTKSGKNVLLELKTGKVPARIILQLWANYFALKELLPEKIDILAGLQINKDGTYELWTFDLKDNDEIIKDVASVWRTCCLMYHQWHSLKPRHRRRMNRVTKL